MKITLNQAAAQALSEKAIEGVDKHFAEGHKVTLAGTYYDPAGLKAVLQAYVDTANVVEATRALLKEQEAKNRAAKAKARAVAKAVATRKARYPKKADLMAIKGIVPIGLVVASTQRAVCDRLVTHPKPCWTARVADELRRDSYGLAG